VPLLRGDAGREVRLLSRTSTDDEVNRLLQLGARMADVGQSPDSTWTVLADPEGNEFCVLSRTVQDTKLDD
jgi:hypothetical protein